MFTGIIAHTGKLKKKEKQLFTFSAPNTLIQKLEKGDSIAVNGCCLTVIDVSDNTFSVEIMPETQNKTIIGKLGIGDIVNFELPMSMNSLLSGHILQGHIDGIGTVLKIQKIKNSHILTIDVPKSLTYYVVEKGSIAVNGISLTVIDTGKDFFTVGIVPYTLENTMLREIKTGDFVNIEVDIFAKYVEKLWKKRI